MYRELGVYWAYITGYTTILDMLTKINILYVFLYVAQLSTSNAFTPNIKDMWKKIDRPCQSLTVDGYIFIKNIQNPPGVAV